MLPVLPSCTGGPGRHGRRGTRNLTKELLDADPGRKVRPATGAPGGLLFGPPVGGRGAPIAARPGRP